MQSGHCGIPLSIKGGPGYSEQGGGQEAKSERQKSREANLGSERREGETYKIYILEISIKYCQELSSQIHLAISFISKEME
jgi:hypothetical protein